MVRLLRANGMEQAQANSLADALSTGRWTHDYPIVFEEARELGLPGTVYRSKGVIYAADAPDRRAVLQVVGRRTDVALYDEWGETTPRTQLVAIGAPGGINAQDLTERVDACLCDDGNGAGPPT